MWDWFFAHPRGHGVKKNYFLQQHSIAHLSQSSAHVERFLITFLEVVRSSHLLKCRQLLIPYLKPVMRWGPKGPPDALCMS